ncbi:MAG TPA: tetratricopeptide repeat-containing protein kinase family protein, partial [Isosphaeraceae bacterium]
MLTQSSIIPGHDRNSGPRIGTPQYMSPEQAAGELDRIGPASDIYSLGATLYALLTGREPFPDRDSATVLRKVQRGEFPPPRRIDPRVPPALEAVCLKAMTLRPEDRYGSARALAEEIEHWLGDEPVAAYREPWPARQARWGRRHRPLVAASAALLVTAVVGLSLGTVLLTQANARTEAQRRLADENFPVARRAVDRMLRRVGAIELADVPQVEAVRQALLEDAERLYREILRRHGDDPAVLPEVARASRGLGDVLALLGRFDDAEPSYGRAIALLDQPGPATAAVEARRELAGAEHGLGVLLKQAHRFEESERHLRRALGLRTHLAGELRDDPAALQEQEDTQYHLAALLGRLHGRLPEAEAALRQDVREQRDRLARDPDSTELRRSLGRVLNQLGLVLWTASPEEAAAAFVEARGIQEGLVQRSPSVAGLRWDLARSSSNLGSMLASTRPDEAAAAYEQAVRRLRQLADDFPRVPDYRHELAAVLAFQALLDMNALGRPERAQVALRDAQALRTGLVRDFPRRFDYRHRFAEVRRQQGTLLFQAGRYPEAEAAFHEDCAIHERLVADFPNVPEYQSGLGCALGSLGTLLLECDRLAEARDCLTRGLGHHRIALTSHPR